MFVVVVVVAGGVVVVVVVARGGGLLADCLGCGGGVGGDCWVGDGWVVTVGGGLALAVAGGGDWGGGGRCTTTGEARCRAESEGGCTSVLLPPVPGGQWSGRVTLPSCKWKGGRGRSDRIGHTARAESKGLSRNTAHLHSHSCLA